MEVGVELPDVLQDNFHITDGLVHCGFFPALGNDGDGVLEACRKEGKLQNSREPLALVVIVGGLRTACEVLLIVTNLKWRSIG